MRGKTHSLHEFAAAKIVAMRSKLWSILLVQGVLVILLAVAVASKRIPLGIPGEWEWLRVHASPSLVGLVISGLAVVIYCGYLALGLRGLASARMSRGREAGWLTGLFAASVAVQVLIPAGAPDEYDLTKWAYVNYFGASTGYYQVAKKQALADPWRFLVDYPVWIRSQDSLHIGTHPPGLIMTQCLLLRAMERYPSVAEALNHWMPLATAEGFRQLERQDRRPIPRTDRAALYLSGLITLLACAGTVVPLYLLARSALPPPAAWVAAALWPLAPAANLFQPDADAAYPLGSTLALALAAWATLLVAREPRNSLWTGSGSVFRPGLGTGNFLHSRFPACGTDGGTCDRASAGSESPAQGRTDTRGRVRAFSQSQCWAGSSRGPSRSRSGRGT